MYNAILDVLALLLDSYWWVVILSVVLGWLIAFDVVNSENRLVSAVDRVLQQLTEPVLRLIRRVVPSFEGLDFSPVVLLVAIFFARRLIFYYAYSPGL